MAKKQRMIEALNTAINFSAAKANIEKQEAETRTENINTNLKKLEALGKQIENIKAKKELKWYDKFQLAQLKKLESETIVNMKMSAKIEQEALNAQEYRNNIVQERYNLKETKENIKADTANKKQENALNSFDEQYMKDHPVLYTLGIDRNTGKALGAMAFGAFMGSLPGISQAKLAKKAVKARKQTNRTYSARKNVR